ncbi:MAG: hypothetical protein CVV21_03405 [Candidatus Goldiibacteriota bacterium HGW-Goldbacteria-1]|jgi:predicted membrane protein|nr:MAG: hypothetical protein CVV21_03405 [Candidatus Goldiibacteriota bacterium HGW-Goldbacteria-1]
MQNKNLVVGFAIAVIVFSCVMTALADEAKYGHIFFHLFIIAAGIFAVYLQAKNAVITLMIAASAVWAIGLFGGLEDVAPLMAETAVIILFAVIMGLKEAAFKTEKLKLVNVLTYKKEQLAITHKEALAMEKENTHITEEIKKYRKNLTGN